MSAREQLARAAAASAFLAASWTTAIALSGGIRLQLGPVVVSSRTPARSAAVVVISVGLALLLAPRGRRTAVWDWLRAQIERKSPLSAFLAAGAVLWLTLAYTARAAGGADTFGYVSHAYLWLNGNLEIAQSLVSQVPWPHAAESLSPLGYRPGRSPDTLVPTYSPGLPLIMAALHLAFGACGPYFVQPLFGVALVASTFGIALRLTRDRLTSALAAVFMASSPALLFNLMSPMSDTATAALWIGSLLLLTWPGIVPAVLAGLLAGLAILVRPNLLPLALAGVMAAELWPATGAAPVRRGTRSVLFLAGVIPAALLIAFLNDTLYGSPLLSGYGQTASLYGLELFPGNLRRYSGWLIESQSPLVLLALLPLALGPMRPAWLTRSTLLPVAALVVIVAFSYLFYLQFDNWWYLRFMLTAFPFLFLLLAAALARAVRTLPSVAAVPALILVVASGLHYWLGFTAGLGTFRIGEGEARYTAVAQFIERELPSNAFVISMQHSGTIRFYAGRTTLNYEYLAPHRFESTLEWLTAKGYRPYILLENWETDRWRHLFASRPNVASLDFRLIAELEWPAGIRLYDPLSPPGARELVKQIPVPPAHSCHPPRGAWAVIP